jgi:hypothetical protein
MRALWIVALITCSCGGAEPVPDDQSPAAGADVDVLLRQATDRGALALAPSDRSGTYSATVGLLTASQPVDRYALVLAPTGNWLAVDVVTGKIGPSNVLPGPGESLAEVEACVLTASGRSVCQVTLPEGLTDPAGNVSALGKLELFFNGAQFKADPPRTLLVFTTEDLSKQAQRYSVSGMN